MYRVVYRNDTDVVVEYRGREYTEQGESELAQPEDGCRERQDGGKMSVDFEDLIRKRTRTKGGSGQRQ